MNVHVNTPYEIRDGETIRRAFTGPVIKSINKEERQVEFIISTAAEDRYGDVITVSGWDIKKYRENPVVLFGHLSSLPPIGKAVKTWKDGDALRSIAQFMPPDLSAFADSIFRMYTEGYLRAVSVGFRPIKYERILDEEGNPTYAYKFLKQELLEFSAVPIPANPEALIAARQKGIDTMPIKSWAEEMLDNWNVVDKDLGDLYGVARKDIENIRRRAAGAGASIQVSPEIQDDLLRRNLEAIRKSKAEKAAAKEFQTVEFNGEEHELPVYDDKDDSWAGKVEFQKNDGEDGSSFTILSAADQITMTPEILETGIAKLDTIDHEGNTILTCCFEDGARIVTYRMIGTDTIGRLFATKISDEEKIFEDAPDETIVDDVAVEEAEPSKGDAAPEEAADTDVGLVECPEEPEGVVVEVQKSVDDEEDEEPLDFGVFLTLTERALSDFEESLDNFKSVTKLEQRKKIFLASYMRELADRIDGGKTATKAVDKTVPEQSANFSTPEDVQEYLKNVTDQLQPMLAEIISSKLAKLRGRLD